MTDNIISLASVKEAARGMGASDVLKAMADLDLETALAVAMTPDGSLVFDASDDVTFERAAWLLALANRELLRRAEKGG